MTFAPGFSFLRRKPKYSRRPRLIADRRARASLSRDKRWKRRGGAGLLGKGIAGCVVLGLASALWVTYKPDQAPVAPPSPFPDFVARAEAAFPEALRGHTSTQAGHLSDGRTVPVALSLLLPAHALDAAAASPDALTRLSAPFVGTDRAVAGAEMGTRIAILAEAALPPGVSRCYTYSTGAPRRIALSDTRTVSAVPLDIAFNPEC